MKNNNFIPIETWITAVYHYQQDNQQLLQEAYLFFEQKFKPQIRRKFGVTNNDFLSVLDDKVADLIIRTIDNTIHFTGKQVDSYLYNAICNHYFDRIKKKNTKKAKAHQLVSLQDIPVNLLQGEQPEPIEIFTQEAQQKEALLQGLNKVIGQLDPMEKLFVEKIMAGKKITAIVEEVGYKNFLTKIDVAEVLLEAMPFELLKNKAKSKAYYFVSKLFDKMRAAIFQETRRLNIEQL